jgi:hypothetical protein
MFLMRLRLVLKMLLNHLKERGRAAASRYLEVDRETSDSEKLLEGFMEEFVGSLYKDAEPWWDLNEEDLRVKDYNELLQVNAKLWGSVSKQDEPMPPCTVKELLRRYGVWRVRESHWEFFADLFF